MACFEMAYCEMAYFEIACYKRACCEMACFEMLYSQIACCKMARCQHVVNTEIKHEVRLWKKRESRRESFR